MTTCSYLPALGLRCRCTAALLVCLLLLCTGPQPGHAVVFPSTAIAPEQARECLLRMFNQSTPRDRKVFSQVGEDGIIETIFECIGTTNKQYAEFGVQDGSQCTTRNLRENHGFKGLMMDGGNSNPRINLQQEFIYSHNIVQLFQKHKLPYPSFDHLTVDIDLNTFSVALAALRGGYRPRSLTVEFNRNFAWSDPAYAVPDLPDEMWVQQDVCENGCKSAKKLPEIGDCYFSASPRAWLNMVKSFGYHFIAADNSGLNLFFVHESAAGQQPLLTLEDGKRVFTGGRNHGHLHGPCSRHIWLKLADDTDFAAASFVLNDQPLVMLMTKPGGDLHMQPIFHEGNVPAVLRARLLRPAGKELSAAAMQQILVMKPSPQPPAMVVSEACSETGWLLVLMMAVCFVAGGQAHRIGHAMQRLWPIRQKHLPGP